MEENIKKLEDELDKWVNSKEFQDMGKTLIEGLKEILNDIPIIKLGKKLTREESSNIAQIMENLESIAEEDEGKEQICLTTIDLIVDTMLSICERLEKI